MDALKIMHHDSKLITHLLFEIKGVAAPKFSASQATLAAYADKPQGVSVI